MKRWGCKYVAEAGLLKEGEGLETFLFNFLKVYRFYI